MSDATNNDASASVVLLGVGSAAAGIVNTLAADSAADWMKLVTVDTQDVAAHESVRHLTIGAEWTRGLGCGGDADVAAKIVEAAGGDLQSAFRGSDLLVVIGCLGRGTASGVVPALARLARDSNVLPIFLLTMPFKVEGNNRQAIARRALDVTRQSADVVIPLANDLVFGALPEDTTLDDALAKAGELIGAAALGLSEMVRCSGAIPLDFASLRNVLRGQSAVCNLGIAAVEAVESADALVATALQAPLFGGEDTIKTADVLVATLVGSKLSLKLIQDVLGGVQDKAPEATRTLVGVNDATPVGGGIQLTILAIRYDGRGPSKSAERVTKPASKPAPKAGGKKGKSASPQQAELPFLETAASLGIFGNTHPTLRGSENLDIPTFQRRGVELVTEVDED
jgi:cell division protein FtsZ